MTTSDQTLSGDVLEPGPEGTVAPKVRGRLRSRLPGRIRTARGQLLVLAGFLFLTAFTFGVVYVTGGGKMNLPPTEIAAFTIIPLAFGALCVLAGRLLLRRSWLGFWLAMGLAFIAVAGGVFAITRVITGHQGLAGDPGFFFCIYQGIHVILGAGILVNLVGMVRSYGEIVKEADRTGRDLQVDLRDIRVKPEAAAAARAVADGLSTEAGAEALSAFDISAVASDERDEAAATTPAAALAAAISEVPERRVPPHEQGIEPLLAVRGLKKHFPIVGGLMRKQIGTVYAVDGVDFDVFPGEIFSLVGESGCGKTTLGRTVLQLTPPTDGTVVFDGYQLSDVDPDDMRPLRRRMQIIFQDPFGSLNPRMPVLDIIGEGLIAQGVTDRKTRDKRVEDSLEIVGLRRDYTRRYPHEFSGGQRQRIGIARALALGPDLIVCDEPVSALDVSIQSQVLNLLLDLRRDFNLTYLFISHNLSVVQYFSDRVGVMYLGKLVEEGPVEELYRDPRHPYTVALLSAIPDPDPRRRKKRLVLKGDVPSPAAPPSGCRFHTRCWLYEKLGKPERCTTEEPELRPITEGHRTACHYAEEVSDTAIASVVATQSVVETAVAETA
ncbi:MAG TPA: oligopeptide/dipeptide ABC transporter ATP-binding protein [Candidatus Limnocylindrales bacterium]|nr:oligopeptide/dipeptide ABC transporter ATP-binding protein [Candidatus Limnocylindrales bacterium]